MSNNLINRVLFGLLCGALLTVWGCATTEQTESLLTKAGFKAIPAATAQQEQHLQILAADKVTKVNRDGKTYFVYPDRARKTLYVGQAAQYEQYRKLQRNQELAAEANNPIFNQQEQLSLWGAW